MTSVERAAIAADDGRPLAATWFRPDQPPLGVVVVAPAMATPSAFYTPFARALADAGHATLTFDYRGMEPGSDVRAVRADLRTWATDAAVVLEAAEAERLRWGTELPLSWVGHSFGGQILGLVDHSLLSKAIVIATGQGHWRHNPPALRRWIRLFWHLVVPASVAVAGYYPGRTLKFLSDLPRGVALQWRRWCLHPGYWEVDVPDIRERHAQVRTPITAIHAVDDEIVVEGGIRAMLEQFGCSSTELLTVGPDDAGSQRLGHHGFFRATHADLWRDLVVPRLPRTAPLRTAVAQSALNDATTTP